jgi:hypothetical protein
MRFLLAGMRVGILSCDPGLSAGAIGGLLAGRRDGARR